MKYPVAVMGAVLTFLQITTGGLAALNVLPEKATAVIVLLTGAITASWTFYTHGVVTPLSDPKNNDGVALVPAKG